MRNHSIKVKELTRWHAGFMVCLGFGDFEMKPGYRLNGI